MGNRHSHTIVRGSIDNPNCTTHPITPDQLGRVNQQSWGGGPNGDGTDNGAAPYLRPHRADLLTQPDLFGPETSTADQVWDIGHLRGQRISGGIAHVELPIAEFHPAKMLSDFQIVSVYELEEDDEHYRENTVFVDFLQPDAQSERIAIVTSERVLLVRPHGNKPDWQARLEQLVEMLLTCGLDVCVNGRMNHAPGNDEMSSLRRRHGYIAIAEQQQLMALRRQTPRVGIRRAA